MQLRLQQSYIASVYLSSSLFKFSTFHQCVVMLYVILWSRLYLSKKRLYLQKGSMSVWLKRNGSKKKSTKCLRTNELWCLQNITIFIQLRLVQHFKGQIWPHFTHLHTNSETHTHTHTIRINVHWNSFKCIQKIELSFLANIAFRRINYIIRDDQHWIYEAKSFGGSFISLSIAW